MSMAKCIQMILKKQLAVTGFLSDYGRQSWDLSGLGCTYAAPGRVRELLEQRRTTTIRPESLHVALRADIDTLKHQSPWVNCLAIATPGLELLTPEEVAATGLEIYSQNDVLVRYCVEQEFGFVGVLGTEWDVATDGPLVQALERSKIQVWTPNADYQTLISACALSGLQCSIQSRGRMLEATDFCVEVVGEMIHASCGLINALIICSPELRSLKPFIKSQRKPFFAARPIINLTDLYWSELEQKMSQQKSPS